MQARPAELAGRQRSQLRLQGAVGGFEAQLVAGLGLLQLQHPQALQGALREGFQRGFGRLFAGMPAQQQAGLFFGHAGQRFIGHLQPLVGFFLALAEVLAGQLDRGHAPLARLLAGLQLIAGRRDADALQRALHLLQGSLAHNRADFDAGGELQGGSGLRAQQADPVDLLGLLQPLGLALADGAHAGQAIQPALGPGEEERIDDQQQNKKGAQHQWGSPGEKRTETSPPLTACGAPLPVCSSSSPCAFTPAPRPSRLPAVMSWPRRRSRRL